ncbi:PIN domain-containing protein [Epidermidibacterium keratini]|uniref:Ribonuclease VapC n=1 Tax=Epidermidibacterium keratini TaxID=1891644 RepID=A0A7L4YJE2_9ACTN|nr:PIN domain-containing protein [Epidermidibacterium keratini]QHB98983.1 PIN domain-containing protein [Epidermidibacterium keratini]
MIALDASVLIAVLRSADPHHDAALGVFERDDEFVAHTLTLAEVLTGAVRTGQDQELVDLFTRLGIQELGRLENEALRLARLRAETPLKLPDCCVLLAAESQLAALATFDARLAATAAGRGVSVIGG